MLFMFLREYWGASAIQLPLLWTCLHQLNTYNMFKLSKFFACFSYNEDSEQENALLLKIQVSLFFFAHFNRPLSFLKRYDGSWCALAWSSNIINLFYLILICCTPYPFPCIFPQIYIVSCLHNRYLSFSRGQNLHVSFTTIPPHFSPFTQMKYICKLLPFVS